MPTRLVAALSVFAILGCTTGATHEALPFEITANRAQGWFDYRSEWAVYRDPAAPFRDLNVLRRPPECINIVNGTGKSSDRFNWLRGRHVQIEGELIPYLSLPQPGGPAGALLEFRVWNGERVYNSCLVDDVFVARSIRATPRR